VIRLNILLHTEVFLPTPCSCVMTDTAIYFCLVTPCMLASLELVTCKGKTWIECANVQIMQSET